LRRTPTHKVTCGRCCPCPNISAIALFAVEFFLKSFIFDLGDDWKNVLTLQKEFGKRLKDAGKQTSVQLVPLGERRVQCFGQEQRSLFVVAACTGEGKDDLNPVMAADFLQKRGLERTALQRKEEIKDIDLDSNDRIAYLEYLLLHYKVMILNAFYKRIAKTNPFDMSKGGIGA
jgi:hypothetical protein